HLLWPGHSTTLHCFTPDNGHFKVFWLKLQNSSAPVLVALAESDKTGIMIGEKFQDPSKYRLTWNQLSFSLSVLNIEQTDIAVYFCGMIIFNRMCFGNGTRLMFEEHFNDKHLIGIKKNIFTVYFYSCCNDLKE
uniref:Immunoglobulin V-set domain-containing protein n=1 Tax=Sinocyclocheilus rhinocerous TaxID=307959 RepID=A0A673HMU0_9TELE